MKKDLYLILETIGTISWILMDFCWMSKFQFFSYVFSTIAIIASVGAIIFYNNNKKSERLILGASWLWIMMNTSWMIGEDYERPWLLILAKIYFIISIIIIIFAVIISKKENEKIDFKRLKLK